MTPTQSYWLGAGQPAQSFALGLGHAGRLGELLVGRLAREDRRQLGRRRLEALELFADLERYADRSAVLLDGTLK